MALVPVTEFVRPDSFVTQHAPNTIPRTAKTLMGEVFLTRGRAR